MRPDDHRPDTTTPAVPIDAELLDRYASGRCTESEDVLVQTFLREHPEYVELLQAMRAVPAGGFLVSRRADVAAGWRRVSALVQAGRHGESRAPALEDGVARPRIGGAPARLRAWGAHSVWYTMAGLAAVALLLIIGWRTAGVRRGGRGELGETVYATRNGQRADITLPDGSTVTLNVGSRLQVPVNFAVGNRTVRLTGEAMFGVTHQHGAPFTVMAGDATARVLGTSFVVRHYATDTATVVAVRSGRVAVQAHVLAARQEALVRHGTVQMGVADSALFGFTTGVLTLDNVPLREAVVELNRWYDADIRIPDTTLAARRIKGAFAAGSLADLSEALSFAFDVRVERAGRVLTLFPR